MKDINAAYKKLERLENDEADSDDEDDMFDDDDDIFGFMSMMCAPAAALQLNQAAVSLAATAAAQHSHRTHVRVAS